MQRRVLATLCLTQITGWGVLFYAFPVLQGTIARDTGWSPVSVTACFTAGQLAAAAAGIPIGRALDEHGPRWVMTLGSCLASAALLVVATAPTAAWFLAGWLLAGVAMAAVLYRPAFAAITRWYDDRNRVRALTILTVAGGLASTVFAPLTAALATELDWRTTYLSLAALLALLTIAAHAWGLRGPWPLPSPSPVHAEAPGSVVCTRAFVALTVSLALTGLSAAAVVVNLVPLLGERGIGVGTAGVLLGLGGLGQVAGRIGYPALARFDVRGRTVLVLAVPAVTTALLGVLGSLWALVIVTLVAGVGRGLLTLVHAMAITDRWGIHQYGRLSGALAAPVAIAVALAPWVGAQLADLLGSYTGAFLLLAALNVCGVAAALASVPPATAPGQERLLYGSAGKNRRAQRLT